MPNERIRMKAVGNAVLDAVACRDKVRGAWMGKGIGGLAGMPYEGCPETLNLTRLDASASQVPNDDLEMQLLWLVCAEKHGAALRATHLAEARKHYEVFPDEYGVARWNMARGLKPPVTGMHNNWFTDGMGAAIRSEIWACLFPGQPALAAAFAREDAIVDHDGDGVWGEMFLAAAESAAFVARTPEEALRHGLAHVPHDSRVAQAVTFALGLKRVRAPAQAIRDMIMKRFGSHNFTDVSMNLAFIVMALVRGNGDFAKTILTAVNCGMDTDCTGATCGAFLGILRGARGIPAKYRRAAGQDLVVSPCLRHLPVPKTVDEATERVGDLSARMRAGLGRGVPADMTPDVPDDPAHDHNQWLIFRVPGEVGYEREPDDVGAASRHALRYLRHLRDARGIHLNLDRHVREDGDIPRSFPLACFSR